MFIAEIVAIQVEDKYIDADGRLDLRKAGIMFYSHGEYFAQGKKIGQMGYSVKKKRAKNPKFAKKKEEEPAPEPTVKVNDALIIMVTALDLEAVLPYHREVQISKSVALKWYSQNVEVFAYRLIQDLLYRRVG